jgi:hypothetical protein
MQSVNPGSKEQDMNAPRYLRRGVAVGLVALGTLVAGNVAAVADPDGPWTPAIQQVDGALAR